MDQSLQLYKPVRDLLLLPVAFAKFRCISAPFINPDNTPPYFLWVAFFISAQRALV